MKEFYGQKLGLNVYTTDSEEAQKYNFKGSTHVLLDQEVIPLDVATDKAKMKDFLSKKIAE